MSNAAILISSCDKYQQFWPGLFHYLQEHVEFPVPRYFMTERAAPEIPRVNVMPLGRKPWANMLIAALQQLHEYDYLLCFQENDWPCTRMGEMHWLNLMAAFQRHNMDCLRLTMVSHLLDTRDLSNDIVLGRTLYRITPKSRFRFSYQCSIWRREFLASCLKPGEDPWQAEIRGSQRVPAKAQLYLLDFRLCVNTCLRGEWQTDAQTTKMREALKG